MRLHWTTGLLAAALVGVAVQILFFPPPARDAIALAILIVGILCGRRVPCVDAATNIAAAASGVIARSPQLSEPASKEKRQG